MPTYWPIGGSGGGQQQSPWLGDIDGASHALSNVKSIGVGSGPPPLGGALFWVNAIAGNNMVQLQNTNSAVNCAIAFFNDFGLSFLVGMGGSASGAPRQGNGFLYCGNDIVIIGPQGNECIRVSYNSSLGRGVVGISGKTVPQYSLDVIGDVNCTGAFRVNGTALTVP